MGKRTKHKSLRPNAHSWRVPIALAIFAAIRVTFYSAAFPLFNNVDEPFHADLVIKYASGAAPKAVERIADEPARLFTLYTSPEYLAEVDSSDPDQRPGWLPGRDASEVADLVSRYGKLRNVESGEPPLYYALAGVWYNLGKLCGLRGGLLIFSVRFLNAFAIVALVLVAYHAGRGAFPERDFIAVCAAGLVAFMPQDAFYSVANDGWTAVFAALSFVLLITAPPNADLSIPRMMLAGWAIGAACLTKLSSLALLPLMFILATFVLRRRRVPWWRLAIAVVAFAACALIPFLGWCLRNIVSVGDPTATAQKIAALHWTVKPVSQWFPNPQFIAGGYTWLSELLASFWRGEFVWHRTRISSPAADIFYLISTLAFPAIALWALLKSKRFSEEDFVTPSVASCFGAALLFIIFISVRYDFDGCLYPSREKPYFTSGRLLLPALIPFALLYARGLWIITRRWAQPVRYALVGALALVISVNEIVISTPAFASRYNFFHMVANQPYAAEGD